VLRPVPEGVALVVAGDEAQRALGGLAVLMERSAALVKPVRSSSGSMSTSTSPVARSSPS
jgi:hypothetical protein